MLLHLSHISTKTKTAELLQRNRRHYYQYQFDGHEIGTDGTASK